MTGRFIRTTGKLLGARPTDDVVDLNQPLASSAEGGLRPSHRNPRGVGEPNVRA